MTTDSELHARPVAADRAGVRLDRFLADQPEVGTRSVAKRLVESGAVSVDGVPEKKIKAAFSLESGQVVRFPTPQFEDDTEREAPPTFTLRVVFEDSYLLVIDKQPGLVAHRPEHCKVIPPNVADLAVEHCGPGLPRLAGDDRPGIVHRLDKDTSGIMVVPKTDEAFHFVRSQFKARTTVKEYRAIAFGEPRFDSDYVEKRLAPHPRFGDRMAVVQEGGKEALTYYEVVERFAGFTDFRCKPKTGRTHQIRVHMMSIGHSLVGDRVYRSRNVVNRELPRGAPDPGRQCLHAERLTLKHPRTHEEMQFEAEMPEDMKALLRWLQAR